MSVSAFVEQINSVGVTRMRDLWQEGTVSGWYVLVGPDFDQDGNPRPSPANRALWHEVDGPPGFYAPLWAWYVCTGDQHADLARIQDLDFELQPAGWVLDIEKQLEGQPLTTLIPGVAALGRPIVASLGGFQTASHGWLDYRTLDRYGVQCNWQAYFDSGEGATPPVAVQELYQSSFVIGGWEYRARIGQAYGWGKVLGWGDAVGYVHDLARYRSYNRKAEYDFGVLPSDWGAVVDDRILWAHEPAPPAGILMGRAAYKNIAVTLDVTRSAQQRPPQEWTPIAASARGWDAAGRPLGKRPISIYLMDNTTDEVARAIAAGAKKEE